MEGYAETAVLVDVVNGDEDAAHARIADFYPNELREFEAHLWATLRLVQTQREKG